MVRSLVVAVAFAACVQSQEVPCADGRLCPPRTQCDNENHRCVSDDQVAACAGLADGEPCTIAGAPGACRMAACEPLVCGDGVRSIGEACDGSDLGGADCTTAGFYEPAGLACTAFCTFDVTACAGTCGDGISNGDELCDTVAPPGVCLDFGFDAGPIGCAASCGLSFADCGRFGWVPEATTLSYANSLDGPAADDLWIAGETTTSKAAAHFNGTLWTQELLAVPNTLGSIAVAAPGDVWIVGLGTGMDAAVLLHRSGGVWTTVSGAPAADYEAVWAVGPDAVFVATADAGVLKWNGASWQTLGSLTGALVDIRGTSADDIWVAKADGSLVRWNGSTWTPSPVAIDVTRIEPITATDVWVIGADTSNAAIAAAAHWDGAQWSVHSHPLVPTAAGGFIAIAASAGNDAWVSSPQGTAFHYNGIDWSPAGTVTVDPAFGAFQAIRNYGDTIVAISFDGFAYRYRQQMYARFTPPSPLALVASFSATPADTIVIDRTKTAYHFDGVDWTTRVVDSNGVSQSLTAIGGDAANHVWVGGGQGRVFRFDGNAWTQMATVAGKVAAVEVFAADDVWFIADTVTRYNGSTFDDMVTFHPLFQAGDATSPTDVWAVGATGANTSELWRWNGAQWSQTSFDRTVIAIDAVSPTSAFAIAIPNVMLQWNGTTWSETALAANSPLLAVAATAPDDAFAVTGTQVFHYDGTTWSLVRAPSDPSVGTKPISSIWAAPDRVDLVYNATAPPQLLRRMIRTRPWTCRATETGCSDGVDDDCDGVVDGNDSDCP